jgi:hypothetical protein
MSARAVLKSQLISRERISAKCSVPASAVGVNGIHTLSQEYDGLPATGAMHLAEILVTRGDFMCRPILTRDAIFDYRNCVILAAGQNETVSGMGMTKAIKHQAILYLLKVYGEDELDEFLASIKWRESAKDILNRCNPS